MLTTKTYKALKLSKLLQSSVIYLIIFRVVLLHLLVTQVLYLVPKLFTGKRNERGSPALNSLSLEMTNITTVHSPLDRASHMMPS